MPQDTLQSTSAAKGAPGLFRRLASSLGPGLITAALVLGPGSIYLVSSAGQALEYRLLWVPLIAGVFMAVYTAMSARVGTVAEKSLLASVADRYGRWLAVLMGLSSFAVCASFQAGDNIGVSLSVQTVFEDAWPGIHADWVLKAISGGFTAISVLIVLTAPNLYKVVERLMTVLVLIMIGCFVADLVPAKPSIAGIAGGLVPRAEGKDLWRVVAMAATTFSVIAALYQSYMVQNKGWRIEDYRRGVWDSVVGIAILTGLSMTIMVTAAAVLGGGRSARPIDNAGDMAAQLEPLLGPAAKYIFCVGLLGASFSSLVANAIVGGGLLADSLGLGARFESRGVKACTVLVMVVGALVVQLFGQEKVGLITVAQKTTVLFVPVCALVLLLLANSRKVMGAHVNRLWMNLLGGAGLAAITGLAGYQFWSYLASLFAK